MPLCAETATGEATLTRSKREKQIAGDFRLDYYRPLAEKLARAEGKFRLSG
jgi:hypothetical protein